MSEAGVPAPAAATAPAKEAHHRADHGTHPAA